MTLMLAKGEMGVQAIRRMLEATVEVWKETEGEGATVGPSTAGLPRETP